MAERLVLVGMMGAGKSTVGALVARRLGWRFVDLDDEICRQCGMTVAELFGARGERGFRSLESQTLRQCLAEQDDVVLSVGGGAVLAADNRAALGGAGTVAWLRARPETLASRVGGGSGRPLLAGTDEEGTTELVLEELAEARAPLYEEVADLVVDTDDAEPEELSEGLAVALSGGSLSRRRPDSPSAGSSPAAKAGSSPGSKAGPSPGSKAGPSPGSGAGA